MYQNYDVLRRHLKTYAKPAGSRHDSKTASQAFKIGCWKLCAKTVTTAKARLLCFHVAIKFSFNLQPGTDRQKRHVILIIFAEINQSEIYQIIFSVLNFVIAIIGTILSMVGRRWPKCVVKLEMF
ncbi:hypothetical protein T02_11977 [Trichinella nativa]|uniref:Uncharacterized protein n=1 Tax=Trichinella nativa TaxID=6335 RepID=A0A0V1L458_9BILA|nr:hypothetical protein T02_11977 [Trichinella nativa]